jgi:hypothetical protein
MSTVVQQKPPGIFWLWTLLLIGPIAWALRLLVSYGGIALACAEGLAGPTVLGFPVLSHVMLGIGAFFTMVCLVAAGFSWSAWRRSTHEARAGGNGRVSRNVGLSGMALFLNGFFFVTTAAETAAIFFVDPCR